MEAPAQRHLGACDWRLSHPQLWRPRIRPLTAFCLGDCMHPLHPLHPFPPLWDCHEPFLVPRRRIGVGSGVNDTAGPALAARWAARRAIPTISHCRTPYQKGPKRKGPPGQVPDARAEETQGAGRGWRNDLARFPIIAESPLGIQDNHILRPDLVASGFREDVARQTTPPRCRTLCQTNDAGPWNGESTPCGRLVGAPVGAAVRYLTRYFIRAWQWRGLPRRARSLARSAAADLPGETFVLGRVLC